DFRPAPAEVRASSDAFVRGLAQIHALDWRSAGLDTIYKGPGYLERQVHGWAARWEKAKTEEISAMDRVGDWLANQLPPDADATLIHNDYKFDNLVFDVQDLGHLAGVLDWEMATIGDPLSDFATTLGGFFPVSTEASKTVAQCWMIREPGAYTPRELCDAYARHSGRDLGNLLYYVVFAQYKGAVIVQQIYARFARGHTHDERFATLGALANRMSANADALIGRGRLDL
ncbi:MAG: phosphotransferase family protein, partial [Candidatus Hydrogenedentales bacterium]